MQDDTLLEGYLYPTSRTGSEHAFYLAVRQEGDVIVTEVTNTSCPEVVYEVATRPGDSGHDVALLLASGARSLGRMAQDECHARRPGPHQMALGVGD